MKKLIKIFLLLSFIYVLLQLSILLMNQEYQIEYTVKDQFYVTEKKMKKKNSENYYFEIKINDVIFNFSIKENLSYSKKIIHKILYFKDGKYECILPFSKNNTLFSDVLCEDGGILYPYHTIAGYDQKLDEFVKNIKQYQENNYVDKEVVLKKEKSFIAYEPQEKNIYFGLENYKGLYLIHNNLNDKILFTKDIYNKKISTFIGHYYFVADYNNDYEFHNFYLIDMKNGKQTKIVSNEAISMYSYINGIIDNSIYLLDSTSKKQYEINIKTKTIIEIGNEKKGILYYDGERKNISIYEALQQELKFNYYRTDFNKSGYQRVDQVGHNYYFYQKNDDGYSVYRSNMERPNLLTYLFKTSSIDQILYIDDAICYKDSQFIKYYTDQTGSQKLVKFDELKFNSSLHFGIYKK